MSWNAMPILQNMIKFHAVQYDTNNTMHYNTLQYNKYNTIQSNVV